MTDIVEVKLNLTQEDVDNLKALAFLSGKSITSEVRFAIALWKFYNQELVKGNKFLIELPDGNLKQFFITRNES